MQYRYVTEKESYEDFAAGRVLLSQSGMTSFPVRLASEIFQRCAITSQLINACVCMIRAVGAAIS